MFKIVEVRLAVVHHLYASFLAHEDEVKLGDAVVFPIGQSYDWGRVVSVDYSKKKPNLAKLIRFMQKEDWETVEKNKIYAEEVFRLSSERIKKFKLNMNLLKAYVSLDTSRIYLLFTALNRVDFRELAADLANLFKARIQLYQLNLQQALALKCWYGPCGRQICCSLFLREIPRIKMSQIKKTGILMVPERIKGLCGKLNCCFSFENE
jgi:cell fate regulator YaaT (PSP1 superfamily)